MTNPIKGGGSIVPNNFERAAQDIQKSADQLGQTAAQQAATGDADLIKAGQNLGDAYVHGADAAGHAAQSLGAAVEGTGHVVVAGAHVGAAAGNAAAGALGWVGEEISDAAKAVCRGVAKGLASIAQFFAHLGDEDMQVTAKRVQNNEVKFSAQMFGKADQHLDQAASQLDRAWNSYVQSVSAAASTAVDLGGVAGSVAQAAGNVSLAAANYGLAGVSKMAQFGSELAKVAVEAAGSGAVGARDLLILSAKVSAGAANVMGNADQGKIEVQVKERMAQFQGELQRLVAQQPQLAPLAAKVFQATGA